MTEQPTTAAEHPEHFCQRCGGPNLMCWHAPSPLWNTVMRDTEGYEAFSGIVCPRCFGELAREQGVADYFCLTTHDAKVPLPSVFGDGRVWDAARCMWVEAAALPPSAPPALNVNALARAIRTVHPFMRSFDGCGNGGKKNSCLGHDTSDEDAAAFAAEYARLQEQDR